MTVLVLCEYHKEPRGPELWLLGVWVFSSRERPSISERGEAEEIEGIRNGID